MTLIDSVHRFRLQVIRRAQALGNVAAACREAGISRTLYYRWRKRYLAEGPDGLRPRPPAPGRQPRQAAPALEDAVLAYGLAFPTHGPARLAAELRQARYGGWVISPAGAYKVLRRHGLQTRWERLAAVEREGLLGGLVTERTRKQLQVARGLELQHIAATRPGELVQIDAFYVGKLKGVGKIWQFTACDAYGSFALADLAAGEVQADAAAAFLRFAVAPVYQAAGHRLERVTVDGGPEFKGAFRQACAALDIHRTQLPPGRPWTNGFVERLQGTILSECWRPAFRRTYFVRLEDLRHVLHAYLRYYNFERRHQGYRLQGRTPAQVFYSALHPDNMAVGSHIHLLTTGVARTI